jgi:hypothetical protein
MDESKSFEFWFSAAWTLIGAMFSIFGFILALFVAFGRRDFTLPLLKEIVLDLRAIRDQSANHRVVQRDVAELRKAVTALGQSHAETLRTLRGLRTDLQALAIEAREICEAVAGSTTDLRVPATPVLLEILTELRKMNNGDPQVQGRLRPFSLQVFLEAQAIVLARQRIQATPSSFLDLD